MARPKSPPEQIRARTIGVRVNPVELADLETKAQAAGVTVTEWLRLAGLRRRAPAGVVPAINREAWVELARLAANLNQLARAANEGQTVTVNEQLLSRLMDQVQALRRGLLGVADDPEHQQRP